MHLISRASWQSIIVAALRPAFLFSLPVTCARVCVLCASVAISSNFKFYLHSLGISVFAFPALRLLFSSFSFTLPHVHFPLSLSKYFSSFYFIWAFKHVAYFCATGNWNSDAAAADASSGRPRRVLQPFLSDCLSVSLSHAL